MTTLAGSVSLVRPGSHTLVIRPRPSKARSVRLPLASTLLVAEPQAGDTVVVVACCSGLVTLMPVTGPPVSGVNSVLVS